MNHPFSAESMAQAQALVSQMTLAEKADFCSGQDFWHLAELSHLGIDKIMVTDGPHGLRKQAKEMDHLGAHRSVPATCFPTASALASSWDTELIQRVGEALGQTCVDEEVSVLLGPGLNIKRNPLCGRNFEYFSEDPFLNGHIAASLVRGIQSQGVGACLKHFAVNNQERGRMFMDAIVDDRTLREIYLKGFEIAVKTAQPWTVMCAYNRLNGLYCSEHDWLLNKVLRDEWGFAGLVMTDWGATNDRVSGVKGGLDLEMPSSGGINDSLVRVAVETGELDEATLDKIVARNVALSLSAKDRQAPSIAADLDAQHALARDAAAQCCVLLKNANQVLPLNAGQSIALIGAFAEKPRFQGAGSSQVRPTQIDTLRAALGEYTDSITYAAGYDPKHSEPDQALIDEAVALAQAAEVAVVFAGLPGIYESEGFDREHMGLPAQHDALIRAVAAANLRTVVVLANGAPVEMPWVGEVDAVLEAYLGGQAAGGGIADVLMGKHNPSGKLAETFALQLSDIPSQPWFPGADRQMQYREGVYIGYRYFDSAQRPVLFPFGHGLSYTEFAISQAILSNDTLTAQGPVKLTVEVQNTGALDGAEVVQVYRHMKHSALHRPEQELCGFAKVHLAAGASGSVEIDLAPECFQVFDHGQQRWVLEAGGVELRIGVSSRDIRLRKMLNVASVDVPSELATQVARPEFLPADSNPAIAVSDELFGQMLNGPVPQGEKVRPFHRNSSVGELGQSWLGAKFRAKMRERFIGGMGLDKADETTRKMFTEMADNMPLRAIVLFQRGKLSYAQIDCLLALLNGRYLDAARRAWNIWRA
ncbi:MAG: glycoside hydrolase family 3 C-terminal domain-containing protein [Pseudomonadota bacterium]|nr:glycoside hydrolase family 3 C-terminal domain-containing protein [Pseudomonadota bacterium]